VRSLPSTTYSAPFFKPACRLVTVPDPVSAMFTQSLPDSATGHACTATTATATVTIFLIIFEIHHGEFMVLLTEILEERSCTE
jgi:hypothetical protein